MPSTGFCGCDLCRQYHLSQFQGIYSKYSVNMDHLRQFWLTMAQNLRELSKYCAAWWEWGCDMDVHVIHKRLERLEFYREWPWSDYFLKFIRHWAKTSIFHGFCPKMHFRSIHKLHICIESYQICWEHWYYMQECCSENNIVLKKNIGG